MKHLKLILGAVLVFFVAGFVGYRVRINAAIGNATLPPYQNLATDVIGTSSGTSTPVGFNFALPTVVGNLTVTSSYVSKIGAKTEATYTILVTDASTTSRLLLDVEGSNDAFCDAIATSTTDVAYSGNAPLKNQVRWFSAGDHYSQRVHSIAFTNASSTVTLNWPNPEVGAGQELILTNLDYNCLRLDVSGASTTVWAQIRSK